MAKDVDLSSREWLDLVFEGKNKDFGAYEIRSNSGKRHNKAIIVTVIGIIIVAGLAYGWNKYNEYLTQKRLEEQKAKQENQAVMMPDQEEVEDEDIYLDEEEIIEEVLEEEVQSSVKVTELTMVDEADYKEPPKDITDVVEADASIGAKDQEGKDDMTLNVVKADEKVVTEITPPKKEEKPEPKPEPKPKQEEVFKSAAHMPSFPGGDAALMSYINKNIHYPQVAQDNGIQGKVVVQFVVEKDGSVGEVKVARGADKDLDKEAVRVCKHLPKFSPGRNANGDPVRVWYTLPVVFKLQNL